MVTLFAVALPPQPLRFRRRRLVSSARIHISITIRTATIVSRAPSDVKKGTRFLSTSHAGAAAGAVEVWANECLPVRADSKQHHHHSKNSKLTNAPSPISTTEESM